MIVYIILAFGLANSILMVLFIRAGLFQPMQPPPAPFYPEEQT